MRLLWSVWESYTGIRSEWECKGYWPSGIDRLIRKPNELVDLITTSRTVLSSFAKAKTAKLGMGGQFSLQIPKNEC